MDTYLGKAGVISLAMAASITLAGCGVSDGANVTIPTAPGGASQGLQPPQPVHVDGFAVVASGPLDNPAGSDPSTSTFTTESDAQLNSVVVPQFRFGDIGALPTNSTAFFIDGSAVDDQAAVRRIADAWGVGDTLRQAETAELGDAWLAGDRDGEGPGFYVGTFPPGRWRFNAGTNAVCGGVASEAGPTTTNFGDGPRVISDVHSVPCTTSTVPTDASRTQTASRESIAKMGIDPEAMQWTSTTGSLESGYPSETVTAVPSEIFSVAAHDFDDLLGYGFSYSGTQFLFADGPLEEPTKFGPYPLLDAATALERLNTTSGTWVMVGSNVSGYTDRPVGSDPDAAYTDTDTYTDNYTDTDTYTDALTTQDLTDTAAAATGPITQSTMPSSTPVPTNVEARNSATPTTMTDLPVPSVVTRMVTLSSVQADLMRVDTANGVWLLPAYRFNGDDGQWHSVLAVSDEYLTILGVEPVTVPPTGEPTVTVPLVTVEPGGVRVPATLVDAMGSPLSAFEATAAEAGFTVRVVRVDGLEQPREVDVRIDRVNVAVETRVGTANVHVDDPIVVGIEGIS